MANKKFLRNILATTSALAITIGAASEAMAASRINIGDLSNPATITELKAAGGVHNDNWLIFNVSGRTLNVAEGESLVGAFMSAAGTIAVTGNATINAIANGTLGAGPNLAVVKVTDGKTLTLSGGQYGVNQGGNNWVGTINGGGNFGEGGIGPITLGTTINGDATSLTINQATNTGTPTFYFTIDSFAGALHKGILNSPGGLSYEGVIGGIVPLSAINIDNTYYNNGAKDGPQTWLRNASAAAINLTTGTSGLLLTGGAITGNVVNTSGNINNTAVNVSGAVTFIGNIGGDTKISALNLISLNGGNGVLTIDGNISANGISLQHATAKLTLIGGKAGNGLERAINAPITSATLGVGVINVGIDGDTIGNVHFTQTIGGTKAPQLLNVYAGPDADGPGSSAALFADATFDGTNHDAGSSGVHIGNHATFVTGEPYIPAGEDPSVDPVAHTLTLTHGATIEGSGPATGADGAGEGVLVMVINNVPGIVGAHGRLESVQMHALGGGQAALAHQIYADALDLTRGSRVTLNNLSLT